MKAFVDFQTLAPAYFGELSPGDCFWIEANKGNPAKLDIKVSDSKYCPLFSPQTPRWMNPHAQVIQVQLLILEDGQTGN